MTDTLITAAEIPCPHRGSIVREAKCDLCGNKGQPFDVFRCHDTGGECSLQRMHSRIKSCVSCLQLPNRDQFQDRTCKGCGSAAAVSVVPSLASLPFPAQCDPSRPWLWRSYNDLARDVADWSSRLPAIGAVCGVPRSGVVVASQLAVQLNVPLVSIDSLAAAADSFRPARSKSLPTIEGPTLIVDDTLWSGTSMAAVRERIGDRSDVLWSALYINAAARAKVDLAGFQLPSLNHTFAWNYLRDMHSPKWLTDMDGVLCSDWPGHPDCVDHTYAGWLDTVARRVLPLFPVRGIVTGRVETYRAQTEAWLARHGVRYGRLEMPFASVGERTGQDVAKRKAAVYEADRDATLFVESDRRQAERIQLLTRRPVLCTDSQEMFQ